MAELTFGLVLALDRHERRDIGGALAIVADRKTLIRTRQPVRPSDAADCAWLESIAE